MYSLSNQVFNFCSPNLHPPKVGLSRYIDTKIGLSAFWIGFAEQIWWIEQPMLLTGVADQIITVHEGIMFPSHRYKVHPYRTKPNDKIVAAAVRCLVHFRGPWTNTKCRCMRSKTAVCWHTCSNYAGGERLRKGTVCFRWHLGVHPDGVVSSPLEQQLGFGTFYSWSVNRLYYLFFFPILLRNS